MAEKVLIIGIERDYKKFLYYINAIGDVCRKPKGEEGGDEVIVKSAVQRDNNYLYFVDKDGDVSRGRRPVYNSKAGV